MKKFLLMSFTESSAMKIAIMFLLFCIFFGCSTVQYTKFDNTEEKRAIFLKKLNEYYGAFYGDAHSERFKLVFTPLSHTELQYFYEKSYNLRLTPELGYDHEFVAGYKFSSLGFRYRGLHDDCFPKYLLKNVAMFEKGYLLGEKPMIPISLFSVDKKDSPVNGELVRPRFFEF